MLSAIAGIRKFDDSPVPDHQLRDMLQCMSYVNVSNASVWIDGPIGLAEARVPLEKDPTPLTVANDPAGNRIVVDGQLDSQKEIACPNLAQRQAPAQNFLLKLHAAPEGLKALRRVTGSFSGAVWNKADRELTCFRDHMGRRPLYYSYLPGRAFVFATEMKPIVAFLQLHGGVSLNEEMLRDYFLGCAPDAGQTLFAEIRRFPPAHLATVSKSGLRLHCYWRPDVDLEQHSGRLNDEEYAEEFRSLFTQAVTRSLISGGPLGVLLSGGMDSSAVASVAADLLRQSGASSLPSFTVVHGDHAGKDERSYAQAVISQSRLEAHFVNGDRVCLFDNIPEMISHIEEPFENPGLAIGWATLAAARSQSVHTLLDGTVGDSTLSYDYAFLRELCAQGKYVQAVREGILFVRRMYGDRISPFPFLKQHVVVPLFPAWLQKHSDAPHGSDYFLAACAHPGFARHVRMREWARHLESLSWDSRRLRELHALEISSSHNTRALEIRTKTAAAFGMRSSQPFADRDLIEFCIRLPVDLRVRDGWSRYILRKALRAYLPQEILDRGGKWSPTGPIIVRFGSLLSGSNFQEAISSSARALRDLVDESVIRESLVRLQAGGEPRPRDVFRVWFPVVLQAWIDRFNVRI